MTENDFLTLIAEHRNDVASRLAYADWLDGCGERDRARYLRADVLLAQMVERHESSDKLPILELCELQRRIGPGWFSRVDFLYDVVLEECPADCRVGVALHLMSYLQILSYEALAIVNSPSAVVVSAFGLGGAEGMRGYLQRSHDAQFRHLPSQPHFGIRLKPRKEGVKAVDR
jgi:uncharacterized protein (TIGR02996 family)